VGGAQKKAAGFSFLGGSCGGAEGGVLVLFNFSSGGELNYFLGHFFQLGFFFFPGLSF